MRISKNHRKLQSVRKMIYIFNKIDTWEYYFLKITLLRCELSRRTHFSNLDFELVILILSEFFCVLNVIIANEKYC